ncbi:hypothetical protein [Rouxiella sp. T17]|uniref:hypothetical protein n=1 Tax=Rouxiella sp. T17 TaxID=3085684 RepID=UPI002FC845A8
MCELHEKDDSLALHQSCKVKTISDLKVIEGTNTHIDEKSLLIRKIERNFLGENKLLEGISAYKAHSDEVARSVGREWDY